MKKFVCTVCGYVYEGDAAPEKCPLCGAPAEKFKEQAGEKTWAAEHVVGVAQGAPEEIMQLYVYLFSRASAPRSACTWPWPVWPTARAIPRSACTGRRPPMRRPSTPPSSPSCWARWSPTPPRRTWRCAWDAENGATAGKFELAKKAKELNLDAIHDTVHEMARDEARHGKAFEGLLKRYFG